jgi:hypothetical protein
LLSIVKFRVFFFFFFRRLDSQMFFLNARFPLFSLREKKKFSGRGYRISFHVYLRALSHWGKKIHDRAVFLSVNINPVSFHETLREAI